MYLQVAALMASLIVIVGAMLFVYKPRVRMVEQEPRILALMLSTLPEDVSGGRPGVVGGLVVASAARTCAARRAQHLRPARVCTRRWT